MNVTIPFIVPGKDGKSKVETIEILDHCQQCGEKRYTVSAGTLRLRGVTYPIGSVKAMCDHRQNWTALYQESEEIKHVKRSKG